MQVQVRVLSSLISSKGGAMEIADGSRGTDLLRVMGASATEGILMIVNGCRRETMCEIEDGDKIDLVTPVAGG